MRPGSSVGIVRVIAGLVAGLLMALASPGRAGTVVGKLELPPAPERGPVIAKGFIDRVENPLADIKKPNLAPYLVVTGGKINGDVTTEAGAARRYATDRGIPDDVILDENRMAEAVQ